MRKAQYLLVFLSICWFSVISASDAFSFIFTSKPQIVAPNEVSKEITVQFQDGGVPVNTTETLDLDFRSTSETGIFLGSTGKPVSKTMSRNTSSRHFYYRDSSLGKYTISVSAVGRESKKSYKTFQDIIIGVESRPVVKVSTVNNINELSQNSKDIGLEVKPISTSSSEVYKSTIIFEAPVRKNIVSRIFGWIKHLFYTD